MGQYKLPSPQSEAEEERRNTAEALNRTTYRTGREKGSCRESLKLRI